MSALCYFLIFSAVITLTLSFNIHLCVNDSVNVRPNSSGTIEYKYVQTSGSCTLTLRGFTLHSYVSIPGIDVGSSESCKQNRLSITINSKKYCVIGSDSTNQVMTHVKDGILHLTYPSPGLENFTIQLYNNVAVCEQEVVISSGSEVSQLSGVLASSYDFNDPRYSGCEINVSIEGHNPFATKFRKLNIFQATVKIGDETLDEGTSSEETFVVHSTDGVIRLTAERIDLLPSYLFIVKYTVLYCETNPYQMDNSTFSPANGPWLVGSTVTFEYNCLDGFNLIGTNELSVECKEDGGQSMFEQGKDLSFQCVPVMCDLPPNSVFIANSNIATSTTLTKYSYKEELKYECDDGYSKNGSVVCGGEGVWAGTPGCVTECIIFSKLNFIANGNISTTQDKYSYNDELKYECDDGYSKNGSVVCGDGGEWTGIPGCVQSSTDGSSSTQTDASEEPKMDKSLAILLGSSIGGMVALVVVVVIVARLCLRKDKKPATESTMSFEAPGDPRGEISNQPTEARGYSNRAGAYEEVCLDSNSPSAPKMSCKPAEETATTNDDSNMYAVVSKQHGPKVKKPEIGVVAQAGPVYGQVRKANPVLWEDDKLFDNVAGAKQDPSQTDIEMADSVQWAGNDLYESTNGARQEQ